MAAEVPRGDRAQGLLSLAAPAELDRAAEGRLVHQQRLVAHQPVAVQRSVVRRAVVERGERPDEREP